MTLRTRVGEVELSTPLMLGSGRITETPNFFLRSQKLGCAGIVTRSLRLEVPKDRLRTPSPRYAVIDGKTMMNCEWSNEHHWSNWKERWAKDVKDADGVLIVSLSGRDIHGCAQLIKTFDELAVDAYEINISCSHSGALHGNLNIDRDRLVELIRAPIFGQFLFF
jgi:dihydroorotate dehydrogenase